MLVLSNIYMEDQLKLLMEHNSQQLVGITKLSFQDIAPQWFDKLTGRLDDIEGRLVMTDHERCMVGEANKFSNGYVESETPCGECIYHSLRFPAVATYYAEFPATKTQLENDPIIKEFVNHWNEYHVPA